MKLNSRGRFITVSVSLGFACDFNVRWVVITPKVVRFTAKVAIAGVDVFRFIGDCDFYGTTMA